MATLSSPFRTSASSPQAEHAEQAGHAAHNEPARQTGRSARAKSSMGRFARFTRSAVSAASTATLAALFGLLALGSSGCASKPTMRLNHAEISGVRIAFPPSVGVVMTTVVDVYNPNSYDVAIRAMRGNIVIAERYTLPIDFRPTGDGLWLASNATTTVRVPVTVPMDLALALARETYTAPTVNFHVTGTADVTATRTFKLEKDDYSVDERGTFTRQQLEIAIRGF